MDGPKTHDIDKSEWPEGPWTYEPDRVDFEHLGLPYVEQEIRQLAEQLSVKP